MRRSLLALALIACRSRASPPPPPPAADAAPPTQDAAPAYTRVRRGGTDATFVVVSDTHVGYLYPAEKSKLSKSAVKEPVGLERDNAKLIARLNSIAGRDYPAKIGGKVAPPSGVVITGDLTEWGQALEWERFVELYGLTGTEGPLKLPVFEMIGNHDKVALGPWVADRVAERHGGRYYAWDWGDLHLLALGEAPDDDGLAFLEKDLAHVAPDVPLVLFFHLALLGPWSDGNWFDGVYKDRLHRLIDGRNVVAIFHGHHHATGHYEWRGIDVWKPGAVKHDAHTFAVVHATDEHWTVASYDWELDAWRDSYAKKMPR
ncbi:MAG: hypothetical protein KIT84_08385 [Labilithrix sp.]|nr:hypothetical protein [Labilithrix sp.]MCW5811015.1 hypothetical protein [Labilithrix sp.]